MENRCQRCNRKLSDPRARYGWRCAQLLGVSGELSVMGSDTFRKFTDGVMNAERLFGKSNIALTDERRKNLYSAFAKMSLWNGVNEQKVKAARREGYSVLNGTTTNRKSFFDELKEYAEYIEEYGLIPGISKKLAEEGNLDNITNNVMKAHDGIQRLRPDLPVNIANSNYSYNKKIDLSSYNNGYINDQNSGAVSKLRFGVNTMDKNGCGVIATYNAMKVLGKPKDICDIAYHYEKDGQVLGGMFGTNPYSIKRYFESEGYKVKTVEGENITKGILPDADAYIVSFWNSDNAMDSIHTVAMRKTSDGKYELFNYDSKSKKSKIVPDLGEKLLSDETIPLVLYCISK